MGENKSVNYGFLAVIPVFGIVFVLILGIFLSSFGSEIKNLEDYSNEPLPEYQNICDICGQRPASPDCPNGKVLLQDPIYDQENQCFCPDSPVCMD